MTAPAAPAAIAPGEGIRLWRGLGWITWRQHRTALLYAGAPLALAAILMAVTASSPKRSARSFGLLPFYFAGSAVSDASTGVFVLLLLAPVIAGVFLGAPLLAAEAERRTTHLVWTQTVSRVKWFIAQTVPIAAALALAGAALGLEFRWWIQPYEASLWYSGLFPLNPLPLAGWLVFGFSLGILLGGVIRRVVPAMAATIVGYVAVAVLLAPRWRRHYLPPLRRVVPSAGRGVADFFLGEPRSAPDFLGLTHGPHGALLLIYQPGSRFGLFELIEFGWLFALSAILIGTAIILIRRRPA